MIPEDRDHFVGLMHVACRRLRHAIEVLDKDDQLAPEDNSTANDLLDCQRIVSDLVEALCPKGVSIDKITYHLLNTTTAIEHEDWEDAKIHAEDNRKVLALCKP